MANPDGGTSGKLKALWPYLLMALVGVSAYFLTKLAIPDGETITRDEDGIPRRSSYPAQEKPVKHRKAERENTGQTDTEALKNGAIPNQRVVVFKDHASLERFLKRMGGDLSLLGRLDKLNALLIGFRSPLDLEGLLDGDEQTSFNYPANIPDLPVGSVQAGALGLGSDLLKYLGITGDNSSWGSGVKIAVLDTGIADHLVFKNAIQRINLVDLPSDLSLLNGHGTAVASLIFSSDPRAPGVAPGATPVSIRIADESGSSTTFLLAQGIYAALETNPQLINISLGSYGQSSLLESAIAYAVSKNVVIISSSGNTGTEGVLYPAAYNSVIAVGAVDAGNQHMDFSTTGSKVAIAAPGYSISAAYPNNMAASVTGTSFSAPIVTGTIAATMSNTSSKTLNTTSAVANLTANLNDVGTQGADTSTGAGVPDMWRVLNGNTPGIYDAAVTSVYLENNQAQVLVQNLGTERLVNTGVSVNVNGTTTTANITTLAVGESRVISVPAGSSEVLNVQGSVQLSGSQTDLRPSNDTLSKTTSTASP